MIKLILATDKNYGIGFEGKLSWHCPEDLQYFKNVTEGGIVVMGNTTFKSLQELGMEKGLPNRKNVVVSSSAEQNLLGLNKRIVHKVNDIDWLGNEGFNFFKTYEKDITIIGGASIYQQLLHTIEEIHHTLIRGEYECDTFFDMSFVYNGDWYLVRSEDLSDIATVNVWRRK